MPSDSRSSTAASNSSLPGHLQHHPSEVVLDRHTADRGAHTGVDAQAVDPGLPDLRLREGEADGPMLNCHAAHASGAGPASSHTAGHASQTGPHRGGAAQPGPRPTPTV